MKVKARGQRAERVNAMHRAIYKEKSREIKRNIRKDKKQTLADRFVNKAFNFRLQCCHCT